MSDVEALREAVERLQAAYDRRRADLLDGIADLGREQGLTPEDMRDPHGRSILLDALTALVTARAALALAALNAPKSPAAAVQPATGTPTTPSTDDEPQRAERGTE